jgi:lipid-A-disaccharide synthase
MKLFFVAGEASGDQHGSRVIAEIKKVNPATEIVAWGGDLMQKEGAKLLSHYKHRAYMGLVEVIKNIRIIRGFMKQAKADILREKPDAIVFVDNPGFNLPLAQFAKKNGIEVHWYIAPKAWAWNKSRVKTMKKCIDHLYVIFPFEVSFFEGLGMPCNYVGNPTYESVVAFNHTKETIHETNGKQTKTIAILAGSRRNEVTTLLPNFIKVANKLNNVKVVVAGAPGLDIAFYNEILQQNDLNATVLFNQTFEILNEAKQTGGFALVASGTATLETALFKVPQVVAYRVNKLTYFVGKQLLKIPYISLVNILLQQNLIEEYLQKMDVETLWNAVQRLQQENTKNSILEGYDELWTQLSAKGTNVSENVAKLVLGLD